MLTDFNDFWWEYTCLYLQQTGNSFHYMVQHMHRYHDIWNCKVF